MLYKTCLILFMFYDLKRQGRQATDYSWRLYVSVMQLDIFWLRTLGQLPATFVAAKKRILMMSRDIYSAVFVVTKTGTF